MHLLILDAIKAFDKVAYDMLFKGVKFIIMT